MTSLAGLAFMASGSSPGRGPYGSQIDKALAYVMQNTSPSGFIAVFATSTHGPMYSHGFGTLFLAEAYGMTHRPEIREKLQKAVRLIIDSQNIEGGWRYQPVRRDADLSVTICQINALRAARNAGLFVPKETVDACIRYVKRSQNPDGGFRYMLQAGATSEFPRSAAGVVALQSAGEYDSKEVRDGIAYLRQVTPGTEAWPAQQPLFLRSILCGPGHVARGGRALGGMVSGRPQRVDRPPVGVGILDRQRRLQRVRNGHGAHHPADTQRLLAHFSTMSGRAFAVLCSLKTQLSIRRWSRSLACCGVSLVVGVVAAVPACSCGRGSVVRSGLQGTLDRWTDGFGTAASLWGPARSDWCQPTGKHTSCRSAAWSS